MITAELAARLAPSAGTRNILVHAYLDVDHAQIALAIPMAIDGYREYIRQVASWLRERSNPEEPVNPGA